MPQTKREKKVNHRIGAYLKILFLRKTTESSDLRWTFNTKAGFFIGKNQEGAGVINIVFFASIALIGILTLQRQANQDIQSLRIESLKLAREQIHKRTQGLAGSHEAIFESMNAIALQTINEPLRRCLRGSGTCNHIGPSRMTGFVLVSPSNAQPIAGTGGSRVFYDRKGNPCLNRDDCNFEARSFFWMTCRNNAPFCSQAERISVVTQIRFQSTESDFLNLADLPTTVALTSNPGAFAKYHQVSDILEFQQKCPDGYRLVEIDAAGKIQCECLSPMVRDRYGNLVCPQVRRCTGPNETFMGLDENQRPICLNRDREFNCFMRPYNPDTNSVDCGRDQFGQPNRLKGVYDREGGCRIVDDGVIECPRKDAVCCVRIPEPR